VCTGKGLGAPIEEDLKAFAVRVEAGQIFVNIAA
jgi:nitrite reductase/ring-hydroxylating ferredoxin subunit